MIFALAVLLAASSAATSDGEVWNEGVAYYQAGDATNALRVLRPLLLSKSHGARAAEVVAKLEYEKGNLEEAANAAQIALRAAPGDAKANRNFTRAVDRLPDERERKHVESVLKAAEGKDPGALLFAATQEGRRLFVESGGYRTNRAERAVALADTLAARAEKLADAWLPVRETIARSVTNETQAATIAEQIDLARRKTKDAAQRLADLDEGAYPLLSDVEHDLTRFLKLAISPPQAIAEDLKAQSNAWQDVAAFNGREWQPDALDYTRAFRAKFPSWAQDYEQRAQSDTNLPPFTAEDQAKISALSTELEKLQIGCVEKALPPDQERALEILAIIQSLLPKDLSGQNRQNQPDESKDNQPQQNNSQSAPQQQPGRNPNDDGSEEDANKDDDKQDENGTEAEDAEDQSIEAVLKKAQERSDEHEAEKRMRMRKAPLPPNERDW